MAASSKKGGKAEIRRILAETRQLIHELNELMDRSDAFELAGTTFSRATSVSSTPSSAQINLATEIKGIVKKLLEHVMFTEKRLQAIEDQQLAPIHQAIYENSGTAKGASDGTHGAQNDAYKDLNDTTGLSVLNRTTHATVLHSIYNYRK